MKTYAFKDIKDDKNMPKGDFLLIDDTVEYLGKFINGQLHCDDGPARTWGNGSEEWYVNGLMHRVGGPALINATYAWWAVNGLFTTTYEDYQAATGCTEADIIALKLKWGNMQYPDISMQENMYTSLYKR